MTRKRSSAVWIALLLLVFLLAPIPIVWHLWRAAEERIERVIQNEQSRRESFTYRRPALFGDPLSGNAWDHYQRALFLLWESPNEDLNLLHPIGVSAPPFWFPPAKRLKPFRRKHQQTLEEVFKALRCEESRSSVPPGDDRRFHVLLSQLLLASAEWARLAERDAESLRLISVVLGMSADLRRGATPEVHTSDLGYEQLAATLWASVLSEHSLSASDLKQACELLDRIEAARPTLLDAYRVVQGSAQADLLRYYRQPDLVSPQPGWRHLGCWNFKLCSLLNDMDDEFQKVIAIDRLPPHQREAAAEILVASWPELPTVPRVQPEHYAHEAYALRHRLLMRTAAGIAWYEAEKGRAPASLGELVPRYLPREPVCPWSGKPFTYREGRLCSRDYQWQSRRTPVEIDVEWTIRRRSAADQDFSGGR